MVSINEDLVNITLRWRELELALDWPHSLDGIAFRSLVRGADSGGSRVGTVSDTSCHSITDDRRKIDCQDRPLRLVPRQY